MLETHICIGMKGYQIIWGMHAHLTCQPAINTQHTHVAPKMLQYFDNKPAEDQGQGLQDLVFLYREKTIVQLYIT